MVKHRNMKGGFLESITQSLNSAWDETKKTASNAYDSAATSIKSSTTPSTTTSYTPSTIGGRKRTRRMRGGYSDNIALTGLAARASPISDIKSAQPLTTVGGKRRKTKKMRFRHGKSHKRRRY
jgi:hypothetical protein